MALSMDEQRMLAEIERRLAAEDPGLAARLSSFRRPGPTTRFRTTQAKVIGSLFAVALLAVVSLMVYAMIPFRAHGPKSTLTPQASSRPGISATAKPKTPVITAPRASASAKTVTTAKASASTAKTTTTAKKSATAKTATGKSTAPKAGSHSGTTAATAGASGTSLGFTGP